MTSLTAQEWKDVAMKNLEEIEKLKKENVELTNKNNAKSDIILNMMFTITQNCDLDDGFYIGRNWGHTHIDEWKKIVDEELKEAAKVISDNAEDYGNFEIVTDGCQFDFQTIEEEEEEE